MATSIRCIKSANRAVGATGPEESDWRRPNFLHNAAPPCTWRTPPERTLRRGSRDRPVGNQYPGRSRLSGISAKFIRPSGSTRANSTSSSPTPASASSWCPGKDYRGTIKRRSRPSPKSRSPDFYHSAVPASHHLGFRRPGYLLENRFREAKMASAAHQFRPVPRECGDVQKLR
jgi:hypothetical protein